MGRQMKTKITQRKIWSEDDKTVPCNQFQIILTCNDVMDRSGVE